MVELERFNCSDLAEGADVIVLADITGEPSLGFVPDAPEERAFFLKEEFTTFHCIETFGEDCCEFRLISQIPWLDHYAWAIFNSYNLTIARGDVKRKQQGRFAFVSQNIAFEMSKDVDFGYFQMICLPEQIMHEGCIYSKFDLIPFFVYRSRKIKKSMPSPPLITFAPQLDYSYIPMVPGQHLQLITTDLDHVEIHDDKGLEPLSDSDKLFTLGRRGRPDRLKATTYVCRSTDANSIFVGNKTITLPPIEVREDGVFIDILKPVTDAVIHTEGIDGIQITCSAEDQWAWDENFVNVVGVEGGVKICLLKSINSLCIQCDRNIWWVLPSKDMVGKI